ncbi:MAG: hypothetical protein R3F31_16310 [Verrucomicrobiales bacterium]
MITGTFMEETRNYFPFCTLDAVKATLRAYDAVIEDLDNQVGRILAALETSGQKRGGP